MKKTLLSIGTIVSTIAPVASVIACGDGDVPGHEAPYSISIHADEHTPTQANVEIKLKGFVSDSYIKEIKSRIAESIAAANKDALKYSTVYITIRSSTSPIIPVECKLLINTSPLTEANKNDLDAIHNFIDTKFNDLINEVKNNDFKNYLYKKYWNLQLHAFDKLDQNEIKTNLLQYLRFNSTNPDLIDLKFNFVSNNYMNFSIKRTDVAASPELHSEGFTESSTSYVTFLKGEEMNFNLYFDDDLFGNQKQYMTLFNSKSTGKNGYGGFSGSGRVITKVRLYKLITKLFKEANIDNSLRFYSDYSHKNIISTFNAPPGSSITKVFGFDDKGSSQGVNFKTIYQTIKIDFDEKKFNIKATVANSSAKQWVFGKDGDYLMIEPNQEWTMEFEGTYELNTAGDAAETIPSLTKAIANHGSNSVNIFDSSAKTIAKHFLNDAKLFLIN